MPDLERLLDEFDPHDGALPPSPAEIRHRGDRRRRRNRALAVVGSAVAVAVIATPLALLDRGPEQTGPPPAEQPGNGLLTEIPDGFPLTWEMPATDADGTPVAVTEAPGVTDLSFCGEAAWTPQDPALTTDVAGTTSVGPGARVQARTLALYAERSEARSAFDAIRSGLEGCTDDPSGDRFEPDSVSAGALYYVHVGTDQAGDAFEEAVMVERYGNALFVDRVRNSVVSLSLSDARLSDALAVFEGRPVPRLEGVKIQSSYLYGTDVPVAGDLPTDGLARDLGPWDAVDVDSRPLVACRPDATLDQLGTNLRYTSQFRAGSEADTAADLKVTLAEFAGGTTARAARSTVEDWAAGCGYEPSSGVGSGAYVGILADDSDDGPARLHALGLAQQGTRLVVVAVSAVDAGSTRDALVADTSQVLDRGLDS